MKRKTVEDYCRELECRGDRVPSDHQKMRLMLRSIYRDRWMGALYEIREEASSDGFEPSEISKIVYG
jgi:hypothetical protein